MKRTRINAFSKKKVKELARDKVLIYPQTCDLCHKSWDIRGIERAHIKHRKMGGRFGEMNEIYNDRRNIGFCCGRCHDIIDGRIKSDKKDVMREELKQVRGWYSWSGEYGITDDKNTLS
jgi:hypothetical protein